MGKTVMKLIEQVQRITIRKTILLTTFPLKSLRVMTN
nr:MAG TPA: hypothetical protein [Caudoviricetes sp.]